MLSQRFSFSVKMLGSSCSSIVNSSRKLNIAIEGNIGSGKSTLLNHLEATQGDRVRVFHEPIHLWRDVGGVNLCEQMYSDPKRWGFTFQNYVQITMAQVHRNMHENRKEGQINFMERSLLSARYVFVENLRKKELITPAEYRILDDFFNYIIKKERVTLDLIVYLRSNPEQCLENIKKRARPEENILKIDDLQKLHQLYENWLKSETGTTCQGTTNQIPVIEFNSNDSKDQLYKLIDFHSEQIVQMDAI